MQLLCNCCCSHGDTSGITITSKAACAVFFDAASLVQGLKCIRVCRARSLSFVSPTYRCSAFFSMFTEAAGVAALLALLCLPRGLLTASALPWRNDSIHIAVRAHPLRHLRPCMCYPHCCRLLAAFLAASRSVLDAPWSLSQMSLPPDGLSCNSSPFCSFRHHAADHGAGRGYCFSQRLSSMCSRGDRMPCERLLEQHC